jgi:ribosomal protein L13
LPLNPYRIITVSGFKMLPQKQRMQKMQSVLNAYATQNKHAGIMYIPDRRSSLK